MSCRGDFFWILIELGKNKKKKNSKTKANLGRDRDCNRVEGRRGKHKHLDVRTEHGRDIVLQKVWAEGQLARSRKTDRLEDKGAALTLNIVLGKGELDAHGIMCVGRCRHKARVHQQVSV